MIAVFPDHTHLLFSLTSICLIRSAILLGIELLSSSRTFGASHTRFQISSFKHDSWLPVSFVIIFETFSMEFISGEFPGHFRTGVSLHSRHVLVLLELWHGVLCIKIYPFCKNATHSHKSVIHSHNNRRYCRVWRKQNVKYHVKCIQTTVKFLTSVQVLGAISNKGMSLQRNVNGTLDNAKYQSDIIHDIEMTCECVVFLQKGYIFYA